jgi:hypothetical protein
LHHLRLKKLIEAFNRSFANSKSNDLTPYVNPQTSITPSIKSTLEIHAPHLIQTHDDIVKPAAQHMLAERQKLEEIREIIESKIIVLDRTIATTKITIERKFNLQEPNHELPDNLIDDETPDNPWLARIVLVGLSSMLFLGFAHFWELDLKKPPNFLFVVAIVASVGMAYGVKKGTIQWIENTQHYDPLAEKVPFWERLMSGETIVVMTVLIPAIEIAFAGKGLMEAATDRSLPTAISAYAIAGFTAIVNMYLAWGEGFTNLRRECRRQEAIRQWQEKETEYEAKRQEIDRDPEFIRLNGEKAAAKREKEALQKTIANQEEVCRQSENAARLAYDTWDRAVKAWLKRNPRRLGGS